MAFTIAFPLLPALAKTFQATNLQIGLLAASFAASQFFLSSFWGTLSDRFGRKPLIAGGLLGLSLSFLLFALSSNLFLLFISRILQGAFAAAIFPATHAYIADFTETTQRIKAMGRLSAAIALGIASGPIIGGFLATVNLALPFFGAAVIGFLNFLFVLFFLPESLAKDQKKSFRAKKGLLQLMSLSRGLKSNLAPLFLLSFVWSFGISNNQVAIPLLGIEVFGLLPQNIGILFTIMGTVWAGTQFFLISPISSLFGERRTAFGGLVLMAFAFLLFPFVPSHLFFLYGTAAFAGFGSAISRPVIIALLSQETKEGQGATMGKATAFESLGRFIAPILGGLLFGIAVALPFLFSALLIFLVLLFILSKTNFLRPNHTL